MSKPKWKVLFWRDTEKWYEANHSAEDVKEVIEKETNQTHEIKVHTAAEIKEVRDNLPKLGPLNKAMKIHEILISSDGDMKSKFLPSDVFYESVKIKESRRHRRVEAEEAGDEIE